MGYSGKVEQQERARELRGTGATIVDIDAELGVSKSSVSVCFDNVDCQLLSRRQPVNRRPHPQHTAKLAEIEDCDTRGLAVIGTLSDDAFLAAGAALYAGEGAKRDGKVSFANTDSAMIAFFCAWLRRYFDID